MQIKPAQQLSVVIPMYNEEDNAEILVREVHAILAQHPDFEIIVVDDGSQDSTFEKLSSLTKGLPQLRPVRHARNFGQSIGLISGIKKAKYPWIVTLDGDGQNDPADIPKLIQISEETGADPRVLLAGHRVNRKDGRWRTLGSRWINRIRRWFLKDDCPDTGCGTKMFSREKFMLLPHFNHMHRYLPALFKGIGGRVINIPVNHRPRTQGQSKYDSWGRLKVGVVDLFGVAWLIRRLKVPEYKNDS
ncbi:MAG: glycosyltransferase family 2 protein [Gammaproteobacteria bacterium]|jgi:dolichol-phosphate mannosyltransferase